MAPIKIVLEKHSDGYTAYVEGLEGIVVGEGDTLKKALQDCGVLRLVIRSLSNII